MAHHPDPNISRRLFKFCPRLDEYSVTEKIDRCEYCARFYAKCCECHQAEAGRVCHYHPFVFVDGACARNGQPGARAGIGCAMGESAKDQLSVAVTDAMDPGAPRTSQRAELLAALEGLRFLVDAERTYHVGSRTHLKSADTELEYVVVADSEYVVKGITEWVPQWKNNNWKTKQGHRPGNVDLFQRLDAMVAEYESQGLAIKFLHVRRELNAIADSLAKKATEISY
ncbi:ribonuclease H-like domain-containing protein [Mycena epipterygia]|nr:ribonuclease H-like domain-containing protein [Mycena epipterygia]